jgi:hypothetical protein
LTSDVGKIDLMKKGLKPILMLIEGMPFPFVGKIDLMKKGLTVKR